MYNGHKEGWVGYRTGVDVGGWSFPRDSTEELGSVGRLKIETKSHVNLLSRLEIVRFHVSPHYKGDLRGTVNNVLYLWGCRSSLQEVACDS